MAEEDACYPFVHMGDLDDAPETWEQVRRREAELKKNFSINELRALLEYHGYGFQFTRPPARKQNYIDLLHKTLYYTQTGLANEAAFTERGIICAGPVGPGTIPKHVRDIKRLPSWYLNEEAALRKIQPHLSLRSAPVDSQSKPGAKAVCYGIAPERPLYSDASQIADEKSAHPQNPMSVDTVPSKDPPATRNPSGASEVHKPTESQQTVVISDDTDDIPVNSGAANMTTEKRNVDERLWRMTAEHVQKALAAVAYSGLQTVPRAFLHPTPFLVATKDRELLKSLTQKSVATSHVNVRFAGNEKYSIVKDGDCLKYCGRGPIWKDNSCFWDSIVVSCRMLNAGSTYLDRGVSPGAWEDGLTTIQRAFLDVLRMDWDFFDETTSIAQRDMFLELFHRESSDEGIKPKPKPRGEMDSAAARWNDIAGPFNQFSFRAHVRRQPCSCQNRGPSCTPTEDMRYITPPYQEPDKKGVTISNLLQRWSHFIRPHCSSGGRKTTNVIHGNLPLRLVVQITAGTRLLDHTSQDISFSYTRIEPASGNESSEHVCYRWLGGIYCSGAHFRVYWNDSAWGAKTVESLQVYDGRQAAGAIIGNVPPASELEPIPGYWMKYCPPLLFYEQVVNPDPLALEAAQAVITDIVISQSQRSAFPRTFFPPSADSAPSTIPADALLPHQLPEAVLKVRGPSTGSHDHPKTPKPSLPTPPNTPGLRRSKRHAGSSESPTWPPISPNGSARKRPNGCIPGSGIVAQDGAQDSPIKISSSSSTSSNDRKRRRGCKR